MSEQAAGRLEVSRRALDSAIPESRTCSDCGDRFDVSQDEINYFRRLAAEQPTVAWRLPHRCSDCRAQRRYERDGFVNDGQDDMRQCARCSSRFVFTAQEKAEFVRQGFPAAPHRCPGCRRR